MKKEFKEIIIEKQPNLYSRVVVEKGDLIWSKENAIKREKILKEVGAEYKQINELANVIKRIIELIPELQNDETIKIALAKFDTINKIRKGLI